MTAKLEKKSTVRVPYVAEGRSLILSISAAPSSPFTYPNIRCLSSSLRWPGAVCSPPGTTTSPSPHPGSPPPPPLRAPFPSLLLEEVPTWRAQGRASHPAPAGSRRDARRAPPPPPPRRRRRRRRGWPPERRLFLLLLWKSAEEGRRGSPRLHCRCRNCRGRSPTSGRDRSGTPSASSSSTNGPSASSLR